TNHILSDVAKPVKVVGGNLSTNGALANAFTISSVSGLTSFTDSTQIPDAPFTNYKFTCTVHSPDQPLADGAYDAWAAPTTEYGPMALRLLDWDAGSNTATLCFYAWQVPANTTVAATAIGAATTLYACETITTYTGLCGELDGVHIENPGSLTCLVSQS